MKILMINVCCGVRSTGRICTDLAEELERRGHEVKIAYGRFPVPEKDQKYAVRIGSETDVRMHAAYARAFDAMGLGSRHATERFLQWVKEYDPDVIHLHNLHGYYINVPLLFAYLRTCGKRILWTLHDCWAFTGHCAFFDYCDCEKWRSGCGNCPESKAYPARLWLDRSKENYARKQRLFTGIPNLTLVTPSEWLKELLKQSFLREYPVEVIPNGIDTEVFRPTASEKREKLELAGKTVVLGVAAVWDRRKGLEDLLRLFKLLDDRFCLLLIGLNEDQLRSLPHGVIGLAKTDSAQELAEYYSLADYFIDPTYEDNYPTTNLEAISCGTPVITYDTGGSPESAELYGWAVRKGDVAAIAALLKSQKQPILLPYDFSRQTMVKRYLCKILQGSENG